MDTTRNVWEEELASYLAAHPKVILAFLFGSFAKGKCGAGSDVDLAVHLLVPYSEQDVASVWGRLEEITHRDVDLVVLNTAPPGIAWTSMRGKVLVDKDPKFHLELMLQRSGEAEDFREFVTTFLHERRRRCNSLST